MTEPIRQPDAEIIPPGEPLHHRSGLWGRADGEWQDADGAHHVRVFRLGPVGATLLALGIGAAASVLLFLLLGAVLFGVAVFGLAAIGAAVVNLLRGPSHKLR
jgi:hypothetical protein